MSNEEKKKPITAETLTGLWARAKKAVLLWEVAKVFIIVGGVLIGQFLILENKVVEVLATPKRLSIFQAQDSTHSFKTDSSLIKHNGYFITLFTRVDTLKKYR